MRKLKDFLYIGRIINGAQDSLIYKSTGQENSRGLVIVVHVMSGDYIYYQKDTFNKLFKPI